MEPWKVDPSPGVSLWMGPSPLSCYPLWHQEAASANGSSSQEICARGRARGSFETADLDIWPNGPGFSPLWETRCNVSRIHVKSAYSGVSWVWCTQQCFRLLIYSEQGRGVTLPVSLWKITLQKTKNFFSKKKKTLFAAQLTCYVL